MAEEAEESTEQGLGGAPVTAALLAANVGVFAAQVSLAGSVQYLLGGTSPQQQSVWRALLRVLGANDALYTIADTRIETLVTSCFLHGSIVHLAFNLLMLWNVGAFLEPAIGRARFLPLYLGSGIVGSACSAIAGRFLGASISVGASGAICGLLGAVLVIGLRTQGWRGPLARQMAPYLAALFLFGYLRNMQGGMVQVDNAAHVGGALGGAMIAATWRRGVQYSARAEKWIVGLSIGLVLACGLTVFVRNRTDPYLFMNVEERVSASFNAAKQGRCADAYAAWQRAVQMDPGNTAVRDLSSDLDRICLAGKEPRPAP